MGLWPLSEQPGCKTSAYLAGQKALRPADRSNARWQPGGVLLRHKLIFRKMVTFAVFFKTLKTVIRLVLRMR